MLDSDDANQMQGLLLHGYSPGSAAQLRLLCIYGTYRTSYLIKLFLNCFVRLIKAVYA